MAALIDGSDIDFAAYLRETDAQQKVKPASAWVAELVERLKNNRNMRKVYLPWTKTNQLFDFRPGEVTVWAGQNGHGKSQVTSQIALSLMGQGERVCLASFEMKPATTLQRMARMYAGTNPFSPEFQRDDGIAYLTNLYEEFGDWSDGLLWVYDQQGTAEAEKVLGMARFCAKELGITHIFIDSLMKCVKDEDDYNAQKEFVNELCSLAMDNQVHIHLVHHLRKPANEHQIPDKHDAKGSGSITDQVDNMMLVWRNKKREAVREGSAKDSKDDCPADALLLCRKQRNGEHEPTIMLYYHRDSLQFLGDPSDQPMFFPNYPHVQTYA